MVLLTGKDCIPSVPSPTCSLTDLWLLKSCSFQVYSYIVCPSEKPSLLKLNCHYDGSQPDTPCGAGCLGSVIFASHLIWGDK